MHIQSFLFDPTQKTVLLMFNGQELKANGNVTVGVPMEKHETIEHVEKTARHRVAEALEAVAKALREHQG